MYNALKSLKSNDAIYDEINRISKLNEHKSTRQEAGLRLGALYEYIHGTQLSGKKLYALMMDSERSIRNDLLFLQDYYKSNGIALVARTTYKTQRKFGAAYLSAGRADMFGVFKNLAEATVGLFFGADTTSGTESFMKQHNLQMQNNIADILEYRLNK